MRFFLLLFLISLQTYAGSDYEVSNCRLYITKKSASDADYMMNDLTRLLKEKGHKLKTITTNTKLPLGSDYLSIQIEKSLSPLSPCTATLTIKRTKGEVISELDEKQWSNKATRKLPRTSMTGKVRCLYAMKDALAPLKKCP